ncbi:MAG TPA: DUF4350 domain-containing protein, partial [Pseudoxanthomonas sp.]|nr:DUF4350 domain-containing protein [Pseudoxanthomonas sp.]
MSRFGPGARIALILLLAAALAAVGVAWFLRTHQRVEKQVLLPPRGEASYNPLYALKKTLQADGLQVRSRQRLDLAARDLRPGDTLLILDDPRNLTPMQSQRLL